MATLQLRNGVSYRVLFQFAGKRHNLHVGKVSAADADLVLGQVELLLGRIKAGLLAVPPGADVVRFLAAGGKLPEPPAPKHSALTLGQLRDAYLDAHRGSLADNTLGEAVTHFKHLVETFGAGFKVGGLELADLQRHVKRREGMTGPSGRPISALTVKRDVTTFRVAWRWAVEGKLLAGAFPRVGSVRFRPTAEKLPYMTVAEVERRLAQGGDPDRLWECVYLTPPELADLLAHVRGQRHAPPWLYPMVGLAGYTGMRRSELLRAEAADVDLAAGEVTVRERKRKKGTATTRRVPLPAAAVGLMTGWLAARPTGSPFLFAEDGVRPHSRTRGKTTGNRTGGHGRGPGVMVRTPPGASGVTEDTATDHLDRALAASPRWASLKGWHVLRHSFISACANAGVDQRMIDAWVGHSTEEQRRRYRHLYPSTQKAAIDRVFG